MGGPARLGHYTIIQVNRCGGSKYKAQNPLLVLISGLPQLGLQAQNRDSEATCQLLPSLLMPGRLHQGTAVLFLQVCHLPVLRTIHPLHLLHASAICQPCKMSIPQWAAYLPARRPPVSCAASWQEGTWNGSESGGHHAHDECQHLELAGTCHRRCRCRLPPGSCLRCVPSSAAGVGPWPQHRWSCDPLSWARHPTPAEHQLGSCKSAWAHR